MSKLYKMIEGVGHPFTAVFDRYGLRTSYLGYGSGSGAIKFFYKRKDFKMNIATEDNLKSLAYVHGSYNDLIKGKMCVVRCGLTTYKKEILKTPLVINESKEDEFFLGEGTPIYKIAERQLKSIKTGTGKTLIYIGETQSGNYKVILK